MGKNPDEYWTKNSVEENMEASIKISFKNSISGRRPQFWIKHADCAFHFELMINGDTSVKS
jgi:hypothetical protein